MDDLKSSKLKQLEERTRWVIDQLHKGKAPAWIIAKSGYPAKFIMKLARDQKVKNSVIKSHEKITKEIFKEKVPALKELVNVALDILTRSLTELKDDDELRRCIVKTTRDLKDISGLIADTNNLLRLELGQSTQNIEQHTNSFQETRVVLQELAKLDPVFEYPALPEPDGSKQA